LEALLLLLLVVAVLISFLTAGWPGLDIPRLVESLMLLLMSFLLLNCGEWVLLLTEHSNSLVLT